MAALQRVAQMNNAGVDWFAAGNVDSALAMFAKASEVLRAMCGGVGSCLCPDPSATNTPGTHDTNAKQRHDHHLYVFQRAFRIVEESLSRHQQKQRMLGGVASLWETTNTLNEVSVIVNFNLALAYHSLGLLRAETTSTQKDARTLLCWAQVLYGIVHRNCCVRRMCLSHLKDVTKDKTSIFQMVDPDLLTLATLNNLGQIHHHLGQPLDAAEKFEGLSRVMEFTGELLLSPSTSLQALKKSEYAGVMLNVMAFRNCTTTATAA